MTNAIEIAIKMETDAIKFYKEASEKTKNPVGKKMFLTIREDEKGILICSRRYSRDLI